MLIQEEFNNAIEKNNIKKIITLLQDKRVDPADFNQWAIRYCSESGYIEIVDLLLKDKRINPSVQFNYSIFEAINNNHFDIVELLWRDKRVKESLKEDCLTIYNRLINYELKNVKNKIKEF